MQSKGQRSLVSYKESDTRLSTPTHWAIWVVPNFQHLTLGKFKVKVKVAQSYLTLCDPWTVACQTPLLMEFSRQEY